MSKSGDGNTFSIDKYVANYVSGGYGWKSLFSIVYNTTTTLGTCIMPNNLSVLGNGEFLKTMSIKTQPQGGGNMRIEPSVDGNESSIGYYNRIDLRSTTAGDMWISGLNSWSWAGGR